MQVAHGPPGASGVTTLMSVGADDIEGYGQVELHRAARTVGIISAGAWIYAWSAKNQGLKKIAMGVALASFVVELISRPRPPAPAPAMLPSRPINYTPT